MSCELVMQGGWILGGPDEARLTPHFALRELRRRDGSVLVHRELVAALQMLRDRVGAPVRILHPGTPPVGLSALVGSEPQARLRQSARGLVAEGVLAKAHPDGAGLRVRAHPPDRMPPISMGGFLETAFQVSAAFETRGDPFQAVAGNFDGQGISFGPSQANLASGTLATLFASFEREDRVALRACFEVPGSWRRWTAILRASRTEQVAWADERSVPPSRRRLVEPWQSSLQAVGRVPAFRRVMVRQVVRATARRLARELVFLSELAGESVVRLDDLCALWDLVLQQGSLRGVRASLRDWNAEAAGLGLRDLVRLAVVARARAASPRWRADCLSRRLGILARRPMTVRGVHGEARRDNPRFHLLREVEVREAGATELALARVSEEGLERLIAPPAGSGGGDLRRIASMGGSG